MPKDKYVGPDPDPSEYLYVSLTLKAESASKAYDAKKACWVPCAKDGFVQGEIRAAKGDQITVFAANKEQTLKKDQVLQVNPPKFDKIEDMSNLTYLNDATVLWNLKDRYYHKLIYTYSGLFCVAINPYKRYPIYTPRVINLYRGKRRTEVPPHVFAVSDGAYSDMLNNRENQSMLITGESGAGKTENTKKVISYFATVGCNDYKNGSGTKGGGAKKAGLEEQVIQTNPVLESFGNAKTVRNDNSSRFGKFIRIHFMSSGKLAGADIEVYLLEKARVVFQQPGERSYHIFYQLMAGANPGLKDELRLTNNWDDFPNQSMGLTEIDGMNEKDEMELTDNCMDVLGFAPEEKQNIYQVVAAVMHLGTMKFKQRGREEQAEADGTKEGDNVAKLLSIDSSDLYRNLLKPKIKVGNEFVTQGRTKDQVCFSVGGLCKAMYDKLFKWLVNRCNRTLSTKVKKAFFIGVLDIAGFEIFEFNSFEQLCINFTNEKLQQFFNHHMFVLEQEEYQREGIAWTFIDFGLDLQACIDLIEKPLGVFSILEEESMFPKASDKTFEEKLNTNHMGKTANFVRPKGGKGAKEAHFAVVHYAGTVPYNVTGWLEKNKDPVNDSVVEQFRKGANRLMIELFEDTEAELGSSKAKRAKGSTFQTVSALYREQVGNLMETLNKTSPHFIRCIIPNEDKQAGVIDSKLVMHQLTCNGVLEGIRICRKGFPNRMQYKEFRQRYIVLASSAMMAAPDAKTAAAICFDTINLEEDRYRLGHTKLFFRTGVVAYLEELREEKIQFMMRSVQAQCRTYLAKKRFKKMVDQRNGIVVLQRFIRLFLNMRLWLWWKLWSYLRPLLSVGVDEDRIKELEKRIESQKNQMKEEEKKLVHFEQELDRALCEKQKLQMEMEEQRAAMEEAEAREGKLKNAAKQREEELKETEERLRQEEEAKNAVEQAKKKAEAEIKLVKQEIRDLEEALAKSEQSWKDKEHQIQLMQDELDNQDHIIARLNKEKRQLQETEQKTAEDLQIAEDKNSHLTKMKAKLESTLDEIEDSLEREKKARIEQERAKRKVEAEVKSMQVAIDAIERSKKELEANATRKDKEIAALSDKLDAEQSNLIKAQKQIKECGARINDLEEELEAERTFRLRAEQVRADSARELQELQQRLEEAGGVTAAQMEINKKREADLLKLKKEAEQSAIHREAALASMRKKHNEAVTELEQQIEAANHARQRLEREKGSLANELTNSKTESDKLKMEKAVLERDSKNAHYKLNEVQLRLDEASRNLSDLESLRNKLVGENGELERKMDEAFSQVSQLNKIKVSLETQLADSQRNAEDEARERLQLLSRFRNLESERESIRQHLEEALEEKEDVMRQLSRANGEAVLWRAKYETESAGKIEELEHAKMKLQARLAEAEDTIEGLNNRCSTLEKVKQRLSGEIEDLQLQVDASNQMAISLEKKTKNFDKVVAEWKAKVEELTRQLDESQRENRENAAEVFRLRGQLEDSKDQLDGVKRENKNLGLEVKDLLDQIGEGGRSLHEVERQKRRLECEKEELANALDEAESALEAEENRVIRSEIELATLKQEIDKRVREKCEDFEASKKNQLRLIESLQASLEAESRSKAELIRTKKKLETDIQELENALDHESRVNADAMANCRRQMSEMRDLRQTLEDLRQEMEALRESSARAERKAAISANETEEARTLLEMAEKQKRQLEHELNHMRDSLNETVAQINGLATSKRVLESELTANRAEIDEMSFAMRHAEEKAKSSALDAIRLAEELRSLQERSEREETEKRSLENLIKELQIRLEESELNTNRLAKKAIEKLEAQVLNLHVELDQEQNFKSDLSKNLRKAERRFRECEFQLEEERKSAARLQELNESLHEKLRSFKTQVEDAEEIAALNLAKFRKAQGEAEEAEKRANLAEQAMGKLRARSVMRSETPY